VAAGRARGDHSARRAWQRPGTPVRDGSDKLCLWLDGPARGAAVPLCRPGGGVLSDHADRAGPLTAIKEPDAETIYITHGYTVIFARYLNQNGWAAQVIPTEFGAAEDNGA